MSSKVRLAREPQTTSILRGVHDLLRSVLIESVSNGNERLLLSSNSLANKFTLERWTIRPAQRRRYKDLFASVKKHSRTLFLYYTHLERIAWTESDTQYIFGCYEFDEIRGNIVLSFARLDC